MKRTLLGLSMTLLVCIAWASPASAAHVNCGDVITQDTTLDSDLVNCPGDGVLIGADNVTLDLAGHTIDGGAVGESYQGVDNDGGHDGVTVQRGRIQEFHSAVYFDGGDDGVLRRLTVVDTGAAFLLFDSDRNTMERNILSSGIAMYDDCDANVIDRNYSDTAGNSILLVGFDQQRESDGNRITRNLLIGAGESFAIYLTDSDDALIEGNDIRDHSGTGIQMAGNGMTNRIQRNTLSGNGEGIAVDGYYIDTVILENDVVGSDGDGINLGPFGFERRTVVERNTASRNGDDGIDSDAGSATFTRNTANFNADLGIEAVPGVTDGGGNKARGNGDPAQCEGVSCCGVRDRS